MTTFAQVTDSQFWLVRIIFQKLKFFNMHVLKYSFEIRLDVLRVKFPCL